MKDKKIKKTAERIARLERRLDKDVTANYSELRAEIEDIANQLSPEELVAVNDYIYENKLLY